MILREGDELLCPRCRQWHRLERPYADRSTAEQTHLYVTCHGQRYFAGIVGTESRQPTREVKS